MQPICTHTISVQSAKASHAYPIIRLPRAFRELAGSKAAIYQTVHDGKLAFLVKILDHPEEKLNSGSMCRTEPSHGGGRRFESGRAHLFLRSCGTEDARSASDGCGGAEEFEPPLGEGHLKD